jgi:dTDP-4-amino-4,6-dideoxygalactose transaminase
VTGRFERLLRLSAGEYTPYLVALWGEDERALARGRPESGVVGRAEEELGDVLLSPFGPGWQGVGTNLGRAGIQAALEAMRLPPGSEVLLPSFACAGVVVPVVQAGHRPVLVDVDDDFNMSVESVATAGSPQVRALILPHFGGLWTRAADAIVAWAKEHGVAVVEDVAQAQGLAHAGRPAGSFGDVAVFSFGGGKLLFGPGGGFVATRDAALYTGIRERVDRWEATASVQSRIDAFERRFAVSTAARARRELRTTVAARLRMKPPPNPTADDTDPHGFDVLAISDIEAALAASNARRLAAIMRAHAESAARWRELLTGVGGVRLPPKAENVFTKLWALIEGDRAEERALQMRKILRRHGVETETLYVPLHRRPELGQFRSVPLPTTERLWRSVFALPARPGLSVPDWRRIESAADEIRAAEGAASPRRPE